ncbi:MAG: hypothetical protein ACXADY_10230 [Candidatus Hodarchaeales archaeon]|jgi:hypothetical protein
MMRKECLLTIGIIVLVILVGQGINQVTSEKLDSDSLVYSTLFGGSAIDIGTATIQDSQGNIIIAGITYSPDFPVTSDAYDDTYNGGADVFVSKFSPDGSVLLFSTFIGGSADESHFYSIDNWESKIAIAVDSSDNIIVHGPTHSPDFPVTLGAYDETYNGALVDSELIHTGDMFVLKLAENGSDILFSTYLGGSDAEENAQNVVVDESDNIYLSGFTRSIDFPITPNALNATNNGIWDAFISKLATNGSSLLYSTYFGGSMHERGMCIEIDTENNMYIGGETFSSNLPTTPNAFDPVGKSEGDGFVAKISADGLELLYATYVSGSGSEKVDDIALDESNNMYLTGNTISSDFEATFNAYDKTINGESDGFIIKITPNGDLIYSTFIGGSDVDGYEKFLLDNDNDFYLLGFSSSNNYPTTSNAYALTHSGDYDLILTKMSSDGSSLLYSSYLGGSSYEPSLWQEDRNWENIPDFLLVNENSVVIVGTTTSTDYPVTNNALNKTLSGYSDVCVSHLVFSDLQTTTTTTSATTTINTIATTTTTTPTTTIPEDGSFPNLIYLVSAICVTITIRKKRK